MSHNLLSGSVEFIGPALGEIEDIVNTHGTQTITGPKTFTNIKLIKHKKKLQSELMSDSLHNYLI